MCTWGSGDVNHLCLMCHCLPSGKVTVFLFQIASCTVSHKYSSVTEEVCVSIPPLGISLKNFFLS